MPTRTLPKMSKLCFRLSENQKMKVRRPPKNHQKSMKKPLRKHVDKKSPKLVQNESTWGPTWVPRGEFRVFAFWGPVCFVFVFLLFLGLLGEGGPLGAVLAQSWGHFGGILKPFCAILEPISSLSCLPSLSCYFSLRWLLSLLSKARRPARSVSIKCMM